MRRKRNCIGPKLLSTIFDSFHDPLTSWTVITGS
jgi:hypothetical protein